MTDIIAILAAAALPERPGLVECLEFQFLGLIIVLVALASLWLICEFSGTAFSSARVKEVQSFGGGEVFDDEAEQDVVHAAVAAAVHATMGPGHRIVSASEVSGEDPAVVAAVTAGVHLALGPGHRIVSIRVAVDPSRAAWAAEGRRQQFEGRNVR